MMNRSQKLELTQIGMDELSLDFLHSKADNPTISFTRDTCSPLDTLVLTTGLGRGYFLVVAHSHGC